MTRRSCKSGLRGKGGSLTKYTFDKVLNSVDFYLLIPIRQQLEIQCRVRRNQRRLLADNDEGPSPPPLRGNPSDLISPARQGCQTSASHIAKTSPKCKPLCDGRSKKCKRQSEGEQNIR